MNGMKQDMKEKRARYIGRNNELLQEFGFAHPRTKVKINTVFNSHFSGQVLWDLFSREAEMIENTWNHSVKIMFNLPRSLTITKESFFSQRNITSFQNALSHSTSSLFSGTKGYRDH